MKAFFNFLDGLTDDVKVFLTLLLTIVCAVLMGNNTSVLENKVTEFVSAVLFLLILVDIAIYAINLLISIFTNGVVSSLLSLLINIIPLIATIIALPFLIDWYPALDSSHVFVTLYSLFTLVASLFNGFSFDEEDEDDDDEEGIVWGLIEKVRLIAIVAVIIIFFACKTNVVFFDDSVFEIAFVATCIILAFDVILCIVDWFSTDEHNGGDIMTLCLNAILFTALIVFVIWGNDFSQALLPTLGIVAIPLTSFSEHLVFAFILYVMFDILFAIPVNILSGLVDLVSDKR